MPLIVGALLVACAVLLAVNVLRGGHGEAEEGEDVDLTAPTEWRGVVPPVGAVLAHPPLIRPPRRGVSPALLFLGSPRAPGGPPPPPRAVLSPAPSPATSYRLF